MTTRKRWTKEEEEILVQAVKANPHNLSKAFREVAEKLGRVDMSILQPLQTRPYGKN